LEEFLVSNGSTTLILLIFERGKFDSNTHTHTFIPISVSKIFHITSFHTNIHLALVSCPSCVREEVGINQRDKNKK
jgi:hypothetical protein